MLHGQQKRSQKRKNKGIKRTRNDHGRSDQAAKQDRNASSVHREPNSEPDLPRIFDGAERKQMKGENVSDWLSFA